MYMRKATVDGVNVPRVRTEYIQRGRMVVAFREYYDCGILSRGTHSFIYKVSPINGKNRPDLYAFFTIEK